jgi:NTP pyrophosphatase (non-canonical NTP hydrolase)
MNFNDYSREAEKTAVYPGQGQNAGVVYCALGAAGEAGEIANVIAKMLCGGVVEDSQAKLIEEIGDTLWMLDSLAREIGVTLEECAEVNLDKLRKRLDNGTLKVGNGR